MNTYRTCLLIAFLLFALSAAGRRLTIGEGAYPNLEAAAPVARPGDTIFFPAGIYEGGQFVELLQGRPERWIYLLADAAGAVVIRGGNEAWHLTDPAYVRIEGFIFEQQRHNGVNIDDGGTYETPAHHVIIDRCAFRDIQGSGNIDLLKLSGLDDFTVQQCIFRNNAEGGSGIDMVGCHHGEILESHFENLGSTGIQVKGGSQHLLIQGNFFRHAGDRACNLGGSTGLPYFRPVDAPFEAADLQVHSNIFTGSQAPVAFAGSIRAAVINNTFFLPERWALRILQETVDPDRFVECGDHTFRNNIVYVDAQLSRAVNTGPHTRPETFIFSNNLWFHTQLSGWQPELPVEDADNVTSQDPLFAAPQTNDFHLLPGSAATGRGFPANMPATDFDGRLFTTPRAIGALESDHSTPLREPDGGAWRFFPIPAREKLQLEGTFTGVHRWEIIDMGGHAHLAKAISPSAASQIITIDISSLAPGVYLLKIGKRGKLFVKH
jgi:hypothetical protein